MAIRVLRCRGAPMATHVGTATDRIEHMFAILQRFVQKFLASR